MGEEEELYNLINKKIKSPSLNQIPPLSLLLDKSVPSKPVSKRLKHPKFSKKISISSISGDQSEIFKPKLPKSFYIIKLKEWAEEIPISGLMPSWEENILNLIPKSLKIKHQKCLEDLMNDIKRIYITEMQKFAISSIVINEREIEDEVEEEDKMIMRTEKPWVTRNNKWFLKNRRKLQKNYFLSHNLMKLIISTARTKLTNDIVDFSVYRSLGLLEISDFQYLITKNLRNTSSMIKHEYYKEIMKRIITKRHLRKIDRSDESKFMRCATSLFVQQILQNMMETISRMLDIIKNRSLCPQLHFELLITEGIDNFDDNEVNISLNPSIDEVSQVYHQVIDDISNIVKNDLLCFKCEDLKENYIQVEVPKWFLRESHGRLSRILKDLFKPMKDHFETVFKEFTYPCTSRTRDFIRELVEDDRGFDIYCNHVKKFNVYLKKSSGMVQYLYYDFGRLSQTTAKRNLHQNITDLVQMLMKKMVSYHWEFNRGIYEEIEGLKSHALDIPTNAKALFELSETMTLASTVTVQRLEKKLKESILMLGELIQLTDLEKKHIEFNKTTINMLFTIPEVFNQCNTLCEAMKSELEDELQRKINVLNLKVEQIIPEFIIMDNMDDASRVHEYIEFLKTLVEMVKEVDEEIRGINMEEKLFKFPETAFPRVDEIKDIIIPFYHLNKMIFLWHRHYNVWLNGPFEYINASEVERMTLYYDTEFIELNKSIKTKIKLDMTIPNKPFKFSGVIDDPDPMQQPAPLKLCLQMIQHVKDFKQYLRLVKCMCNPALTQRHWTEMSAIYGTDITPNAGTTLKKIIALDLMENIEKYEVISISANKELALQKQLDSMSEEWNDVMFDIIDDGVKLSFVNYQDIQIKMEEHLVKIQEMKGSYFVKPIAEDVVRFHRGLICVKKTVDEWNSMQEQLIVVKPVFEYSKKPQLRSDFEEFHVIFEAGQSIEVHLDWIRKGIMEDPSFQGIERCSDYLEKLQECQSFINVATKTIHEHLDKMRRIFPRFFFLSNNEVMDILFGKSGNNIIGLLRKCFSGIKAVKYDSDSKIIGIMTDYDQEFDLSDRIDVEGWNWLVETEAAIIAEVRRAVGLNVAGKIGDCGEFIKKFVSNVFSISICTLKTLWTSKVEDSLENPEGLMLILRDQNSLISSAIEHLKNGDLVEKMMKKNQRLILMTLTSILIHQRDIISLLISNEVVSEEDFNWMSQLRHYLRGDTIKVEMIYAIRNYGYEFNSVINSFINTPLTDRIYHTIFQAAKNNYFCSLIGPADTGKTETIKYLAVNELGYQHHLFNCTENLSCRRISDILKGLITCGAWVCFKNLDKMKISVLSAITQKFDRILKIISTKNTEFEDFDGDSLLIKSSGFILGNLTVSPGSFSEFLNKKTIPDNLKSLFRPITINHPDLRKIFKVNLISSGFKKSREISKKVEILYKFCSEQFNYQSNYLFGLRSLVSIVRNSVRLKYQFCDEEDEEVIVLRSIIDVHLPLLVEEDVPVFLGFLRDTFKDIRMIPPNYQNFLKTLDKLAESEVFEVHQDFKLKIIQILEILVIKHSFIIVGESFTGKTKILKILAKCLMQLANDGDDLGVSVEMEVVNHKSMKMEDLFGFNEKTSGNVKWTDGICTSMLRRFSSENSNGCKVTKFSCRKWLIFDGPMESPWMETFVTIMDNNRALILESGEKIEFPEELSLIIETETLKNSTPAVISRCGIISMEIKTIGWESHMRSWIIEQNSWIKPKRNGFMETLLKWSLGCVLEFVRIHCESFLKVTDVFLVMSTLRLLKIYLQEAFESNSKEGSDTHFDFHFEIWFQACLILAIIWGIGGALSSDESRNKLDEFISSNWPKKPENICSNDLSLPEGLIQDHNYIFRSSGVWKSWTELIKNSTEFFIDPKFIPNTSSIKLMTILESHVKQKIPFVLCGDRSVGKTMMMRFVLKKRLTDKYLSNVFNFTKRTTADQAQKFFLLKMNRIMKGHYSAPKGKYSINFIDDLNMMIDEENVNYGLPLELIRQLMDHGYWYGTSDNEEKFQKILVEDVMFVAALTLSEQNSADISSRFIRHFNLYSVNPPPKENIFKIFSNVLLNNLKKNQFSADVSTSVNAMVNATILIYNSILSNEKYRAIPLNNFKYQFNLRDIARVINGCSLIQRESAETKVTLIRLWVHETLRVFSDRMTNKDHHDCLFSLIKEAIALHFSKESFDSIFDHLPKQNDQLTTESFDSLMFCSFMESSDHKDDLSIRRRKYEEVTLSKETIRTKLMTYLTQLNERSADSQKIELIIFSDVIAHLIRLCRCLCIPSGNCLMLSIGGGSTGRRSLTRLSSFVQRSEFFELTNNSPWREDLKGATRHIAATGGDSSFFIPCRYLNDNHLMDINSLMSTGEIPDLFLRNDERQEIIKSARLPAQNGDRNLEIGIVEVMNYFHEQCQEKLHFILYINLFDEAGCRVNSSCLLKPYTNILSFCYIDCFEDWPQEAFNLISTKFLHDLSVINSFTKEKVVAASVNIYEHSKTIKSANNYKTTVGPYAFIHMMKIYSSIIIKKHEKITESRHRYQVGLEKLQYAEQEVSKIKTTLIELKPQLEWSAKQTEKTMREIESENIIVENATIQVKKDEEVANKVARVAATLKAECEADLAVAIPILEDAIAALNTLKPTDITLVKAMKNPPDTVKLVLAAVCVMLNVPSDRVIDPVTGKKSMDYWGPSKRILGEMNFLQSLKDYDKDHIPPSLMAIVKKTYMTDKNFMPHIVAKASSAAEGLCKWVRAMVSYDEIAKIVAPKKEKLATAEKECNESLAFLNEKRKTLVELTNKLIGLNEILRETLAKKLELENEVRNCTEKLGKSEGLIASLDGEKIKWRKSLDLLKNSLDTLPGDLLVSCGIIAFLSSFDNSCRNETVERWREIVQNERISISRAYDFLLNLESDITIESWHFAGLSRNRFYEENAVIMKNSGLWCLLIDPQHQANLWIRKTEEKNHLKIFKSSEILDIEYLESIRNCMVLNRPILLENLTEDFGPFNLDTIHALKNEKVTNKLRIYMTTRLRNPSFNPYILKKTNVINFHLPEDALHEQLLDIVVSREQPELQEKFNDLNIKSNLNKQILKQEEKNILNTLSSTSTSVSILEDERALKILDTSKKLSVEIRQKEEATRQAQMEIDEFRMCYKRFTSFSAGLYNTLTSLAALNHMYQFSLVRSFTQLFTKSIDTSKRSYLIDKRLEYLKCSFTQTLHTSVRNALFEDHKIIYTFLLCLKLLSSDNDFVKVEEIDYFFKSIKTFDSNNLSEQLNELSTKFPVFGGIAESLNLEEEKWRIFFTSKLVEFPVHWSTKLTAFQKILLIKILRPEKLIDKIRNFVNSVMTKFHLSVPTSEGISQSYSESTCLIPLIFILPTYIEPLEMIREFGKSFGYTSKIFTVSLGGENDHEIEGLIASCQREGSWILIQNCHLADSSTMFLLERIYENQNVMNNALIGFRLWLSSYPTKRFPVGILQDGIKIASSSPKDLKKSLISCYQADPLNKLEFFSSCPGNDKTFAKMIYGLSLFHSILRERRKFGRQGFNVSYDFFPSDFTISVRELRDLLRRDFSGRETKYFVDGVFYLIGKCNYGGRIVDAEDENYVMEVLRNFCNAEIGRKNYCVLGEFSGNSVMIPDRCEYRDFLKHIRNIDDSDDILEVFGLDENVKVKTDLMAVRNFGDSLNLLGNDGLIERREIFEFREIAEMMDQLSQVFDVDDVKRKFSCEYLEPLNYVLIHEINYFNLMIGKLKLMIENAEFQSIERLSLPNLIQEFKEKFIFFNKWIDSGFPKEPIKLGLFFFPRKFISTLKIMFSRECAIDVTEIGFKSEIMRLKNSEVSKLVNDRKSIFIEGLVLSGGRWSEDEGKLVVNSAKESLTALPIVRLTPRVINRESTEVEEFLCPLYKSFDDRDSLDFSGNFENFIGRIELKSDLPKSFWAKRGTALFCRNYSFGKESIK